MALSPNMLIIKEYVEDKYSDLITHIGVTNCRKIAGSQTYSQHSWPNAIDIHVTNEFKANSIEKSNGDAIFADLQRTFGDYLYEKIWWTTNHWNHIHVSTYPKGWLTPPCAGGELKIRFEDGTVQSVSEFPETIVKEDDLPYTEDQLIDIIQEAVAGMNMRHEISFWLQQSRIYDGIGELVSAHRAKTLGTTTLVELSDDDINELVDMLLDEQARRLAE